METREEVASSTVARMNSRARSLAAAYPFEVDDTGNAIYFTAEEPDIGQAAYLVSLLLSNLKALTPLLDSSELHPSDQEVRKLRQYFQYFATAAIASEIGGPAWSFGFPRPDGTGFIEKLSEIWKSLMDGKFQSRPLGTKISKRRSSRHFCVA